MCLLLQKLLVTSAKADRTGSGRATCKQTYDNQGFLEHVPGLGINSNTSN
jgi:hypothetical protein